MNNNTAVDLAAASAASPEMPAAHHGDVAPAGAAPQAPASPWAALLESSGTRYAALLSDTHPQWLDSWLPAVLRPPTPLPAANELRLAQLLLKRMRLQWPPLSRWRRKAHRIRLLPQKDALRVFSLIGLFAHPALLTHTIDGERWRMTRDVIGAQACETLMASKHTPLLRGPSGRCIKSLYALADWGLNVVGSGVAKQDQDVVDLMRLYLPVHGVLHRPLSASECRRASGVCDEFFERTEDFIPDLAWLFGSNLDG